MKDRDAADSQFCNQRQGEKSEDSEQPPDADRSTPDQNGPDVSIKPVREKISEGHDNLQRREQWFQRRSGKGK